MSTAQLLAHFDRISDAPDAIPQFRRFILDLAVRGKLVEQDPKDIPVRDELVLNDQMRRITAMGDQRADADLQTLLAAEDRWEVPTSWQ